MKKIYLSVLIIFSTLLFTSCNIDLTQQNESSKEQVTTHNVDITYPVSPTKEIVLTYPPATVPVYTEESTETEESYPPYEDKFTSFMELPNRDVFVNKRVTIIPEEKWNHAPPLAIFRVVGMEEEYEGYNTVYQIQFVDFYGVTDYDGEGIYSMVEMGHLEEQLYGRPPLEIGELYARLWIYNPPGRGYWSKYPSGILYKVEEQNGKRYLYPYCTDLSEFACKIPITDPVENCPYKKGKHDKVIAYLNEHNIPLPTFDYKVEAGEYFAECRRRRP